MKSTKSKSFVKGTSKVLLKIAPKIATEAVSGWFFEEAEIPKSLRKKIKEKH